MSIMQISINPYHRSVTINNEEVIQKIIPYPDDINSIASVTCEYNDETKKITDVSNIHRYVNHYIAKEYYFQHVPVFIDWFYAEKEAQALATIEEANRVEAIESAIDNANTVIANAQKTIQETEEKVNNFINSMIQNGNSILVQTKDTNSRRPLTQRFADVINVRDYGAIGDGITDDSNAFITASQVAKDKNAILYIPVGDFKVSALPDVACYGSGNIHTIEDDKIYRAFDLLFQELNDSLIFEKIEDVSQELNTFQEIAKQNFAPNTREIITESCEWNVPVTGWYKITLIGGGQGGYSWVGGSVRGIRCGTSGGFKKELVHLTKDEVVSITIGAGGIGKFSNTVYNSVDYNSTYGSHTNFGELDSNNSFHFTYSTKNLSSTEYVDDAVLPAYKAFYGSGGEVRIVTNNSDYTYARNGSPGCVIIEYYNSIKDTNIPEVISLQSFKKSRIKSIIQTTNVVSPNGNRIVININDLDNYLNQGYITDEEYQENQKTIAEQKYQEWLTSDDTLAERMSMLRQARDYYLKVYDTAKNQLDRQIALADESTKPTLLNLLNQWYAYAEALCALPSQEGSPWDGGGKLTPFPQQPPLPTASTETQMEGYTIS